MKNSKANQEIIVLLKKDGYKEISINTKKFTWNPDFTVTNGKETVSYLIRESESIPESLAERISSTKTAIKEFKINVLFKKYPNQSAKKSLSPFGIGIQFVKNNTIKTLTSSKLFTTNKDRGRPPVAEKKTRWKMPKTDVFLSSKQDFVERLEVKKVIDEIRIRDEFPVYPFQVEDDLRYGGNQTEQCINEGLHQCEWFISVLGEERRYWVEKEVRKSLKLFPVEDIIVYVKLNQRTQDNWKKLLEWLESKNIKYLPYLDYEDLKTKVSKLIRGHIEKLHKEHGVPMYPYQK